ncbi:MAG TPA: lysophospholipid acyltransferase family protein [Caulobacteraceae bacterium]|nr:lysophospholipid acyltransferase family protein [Caulobacteraceae bacterium]
MAARLPPVFRSALWRLEALAYDAFSALVRLLPTDLASWSGGALFRALGPLSGAHRTARRNLVLAFPDMGEADRRRILSAQWENFGRYVAEFPLVARLTPASGRVEVVGGERLAAVAAAGRPVVLVSGHFSNLEVMAAVIVAAGVECDITYRAANNPLIDRRIREGRLAYGVRLLAAKGEEGARELLAALKAGQSVAMMNDQKYEPGIDAPFFGRPVKTLPAAVRLAQRFGTYILPMSIQRRRGARFTCYVHEPIEVPESGDRAADIEAGVAAINAFIEARVRERPGEWWWMHRRWPPDAYAELAARGL